MILTDTDGRTHEVMIEHNGRGAVCLRAIDAPLRGAYPPSEILRLRLVLARVAADAARHASTLRGEADRLRRRLAVLEQELGGAEACAPEPLGPAGFVRGQAVVAPGSGRRYRVTDYRPPERGERYLNAFSLQDHPPRIVVQHAVRAAALSPVAPSRCRYIVEPEEAPC